MTPPPTDKAFTRRVICSLLKNEELRWPEVEGFSELFLDQSAAHCVQPLLACVGDGRNDLPIGVHRALERARREQTLVNLVWEPELREVLELFRTAGISSLLIKGGALAYLAYPAPELRPRADTDLLIPVEHRDRAQQILVERGYAEPLAVRSDVLRHQRSFARELPGGIELILDLHWELTDLYLFRGQIGFEELNREALPIPQLGPGARGLSAIDALILAAIHRVAHHANADDLIWLYDIHLLLAERSPEWFREFETRVRRYRAGVFVAESLECCYSAFGDALPAGLLVDLRAGSDRSAEIQQLYLDSRRRLIDFVKLQLRAIPGWVGKFRYLLGHLFPDAEYMQRKYSTKTPLVLPLLYLRRIAAAIR